MEREIFDAARLIQDDTARRAYLEAACAGDEVLLRRVEVLLKAYECATGFLEQPVFPEITPADGAGPHSDPPGQSPGVGHGNLARIEPFEGETIAGDGVNVNHALSFLSPPFVGETIAEDGVNEDHAFSFLSPATQPDSLGRIGHYEVLEVLGQGGFGIVFRGFDETLHRVVAIKVLAPQLAATSPPRKRFLREARSAAAVRHENVVQVYAVEEQPLPHLVMEFIPGETLQQRLDRTGPLEVIDVVTLGRQIALGLAAAHAQGLIHRDIKPGNILLETGPHPRARITDFGLARAADEASMTQSGLVAGTPMYMAPEQANGETLDHRTDLFSLGSVLYTMITGRPPFRAATMMAVLKRVVEDTPRPIRESIPEAPEWLCGLIARLHAKNPADRPASAREVADWLAKGPQHRPADGKPAAIPLQIRPRSPGRHRLVAASLLLALLVGLELAQVSGVADVWALVMPLFVSAGTLVVEVDDPGVSVWMDGSDMVITGTGVKELRVVAGEYRLIASKNGRLVQEDLVTVEKNGRHMIWVSREAAAVADQGTWERLLASLPPDQRGRAIAARLKVLNPGFNGLVMPTLADGVLTGLSFLSAGVEDISPVRALETLQSLHCDGDAMKRSRLHDLSPLAGLRLTSLSLSHTEVSDLSPLKGMPLAELRVDDTRVVDLSPLQHMGSLRDLHCNFDPARDAELLRSIKSLERLNGQPAAEVLSEAVPREIINSRGMTPSRSATR